MESFLARLLPKHRRSRLAAKFEATSLGKSDYDELQEVRGDDFRSNLKPTVSTPYIVDDQMEKIERRNRTKKTKEGEEGTVSSDLFPYFEPSDITYLEDAGIYGRFYDKAKLLERVLSVNDSDIKNLSIVPVCGPPGVGKTTLISMVYDDSTVRQYFRLRCWFRGSGSLDTVQLRNEFLEWTDFESKGTGNILIVLDDIAEFSLEDLESFSGCGRIVVIVASESLKTSALNPFQVSRLDDSECWDLLMKCVFDEYVDASMFEDVDNRIVSLCDGLPLVAKIIGGVLWHVTVEKKWCEVYETFSVQLKRLGDAIAAALMVSYSSLSADQRSRFLICSTFGKGIEFTEEEVLDLWTRAGLVGSRGSKGVAEFGNEYFDELQRKALFESSYPLNSETNKFELHTSVYDFCLKIEAEENRIWHVRPKSSGDETVTEEEIQTKVRGDVEMEIQEVIQTEIKSNAEATVELDQVSQNFASGYAPVGRSGIAAQTCSVHRYPFITGREGDRQKLVKLLQSDACSQQNVSLVSLVADAGVGKTTLSRLVYHDSIVCETFDIRAWASISEINNLEGLLEAIIVSVTGISSGLSDLAELQEILQEELMCKKVLIVLDNILRHDHLLESDFLDPLRSCAKGSIVMVTSRVKLDINIGWKTQTYYLDCLTEEDCWLIIQEYAFCATDPICFPGSLEISKRMVPKCKGKPLAAKVIGGLLPYIIIGQFGKDILNDELWNLDGSGVMPALKGSSSPLTDSAKKK